MIAGDWHGNTKYAIRAVEHAKKNNAYMIWHVGDFGFNFENSFMQPLNAALKANYMQLIFAQGNHDNPYILTAGSNNKIGLVELKSNIFHAPRNWRYKLNSTSFLFLGGAVSVDRTWRTPGVDWWHEEVINIAEAEQAMSDGYADIMVCHDVPDGVDIRAIQNNPMGWPAHALREAQAHREVLRAVVDEVKPKMLFAGHYHTRESHILKGKDYTTQVEILDCDGTPLHLNTTFLEL